jgi:hypothetical protein
LLAFGTVSHELYRKRRNAAAPFFSKRSVDLATPIFRKNVDLLCTLFQKHLQNNELFNLHVDYLAYSTESVLNSGFGGGMGLKNRTSRLRIGENQ